MCIYYFLELFLEDKLLEIELKMTKAVDASEFCCKFADCSGSAVWVFLGGPFQAVHSHSCAWIACSHASPADPQQVGGLASTRLGLPVI